MPNITKKYLFENKNLSVIYKEKFCPASYLHFYKLCYGILFQAEKCEKFQFYGINMLSLTSFMKSIKIEFMINISRYSCAIWRTFCFLSTCVAGADYMCVCVCVLLFRV
jgi:hypothetical protein